MKSVSKSLFRSAHFHTRLEHSNLVVVIKNALSKDLFSLRFFSITCGCLTTPKGPIVLRGFAALKGPADLRGLAATGGSTAALRSDASAHSLQRLRCQRAQASTPAPKIRSICDASARRHRCQRLLLAAFALSAISGIDARTRNVQRLRRQRSQALTPAPSTCSTRAASARRQGCQHPFLSAFAEI